MATEKPKFDIVTAEAVTVENVEGRTLFYIKLVNTRGEKHFVNVGEKTHSKLAELQTLKDAKTEKSL